MSGIVGNEADEVEETKDPDGDYDVTKAAVWDGELVEAIVDWNPLPSTNSSPNGEEDVLCQYDEVEYCLPDKWRFVPLVYLPSTDIILLQGIIFFHFFSLCCVVSQWK